MVWFLKGVLHFFFGCYSSLPYWQRGSRHWPDYCKHCGARIL